MIRWFGKALGRVLLVLLVLALILLIPVARTELACRGEAQASPYDPLITDPAWQRPESRTLLTYPEWHIVHAYEDYATVIATGDPHDFAFLRAIGGYWSSLCDLTRAAAAHGGADGPTRQMVYTIGVSFTAELLAKAAYEETLGRLATLIRGKGRAPLDDLSARQAADYAGFLQQVPWYRWDFRADAAALQAARTDAFRDRERALALGLEYRVKAGYARVIAAAVAGTGADELRLRSVIAGVPPDRLAQLPGIAVIGPLGPGTLIETDRYRAFTRIAARLAAEGAQFVEIGGNDDILLTYLSPSPDPSADIAVMARQGSDDYRHLRLIKVRDLAAMLRDLATGPGTLEHIHDY